MNLEPNEDQSLLFDSVDAMLASYYKPGFRAESVASEIGWSAKAWESVANLGLTTLSIDEAHDGAGAGASELYVTQLAIGKHAAVEPLLEGVFLPSWLIAELGSAEQQAALLAPLVSGEETVAVAHAEPGNSWDALPAVTATDGPDGTTLNGVKSPVVHADQAISLLVTAVDRNGDVGLYVVQRDASGMSRVDGRTTDWTHASEVRFANTPATPLGVSGAAAVHAFDIAFAKARIALLGEAIGLMDAGLSQTVEYLKSRKQFGVSLSTFQSLVHRSADLYAEIELARSIGLWATAMAEAYASGDETDLVTVADDAFVFVADAARKAAEEIVQLHGGIGMTFETSVSHYAARLTGITQAFGGVAATRRRAVASASPTTPPSALRDNAMTLVV
ncbi:acyl-CoA dehydrogenase family protein [Rhodococcus sp. G-MC3]|uniref:acyl-CoA dehydrogenase family protein n=1 Tax=Rhodococcus sp. G-MC3 TaxID=3046209 RepID=UPI0024B97629|nr:acyl-CoA dehydrogenase family protein [Rhodococcus sp. G-MC3]MDJ0394879.1 acyl-CoA dehydrogenase family protein [Rhodococcus sp. G-MC3]